MSQLMKTRLGQWAVCDAAACLPERLKHETKVLLVVEMPEKAKAVELVIGVGVIQLLEELQLFQTRLLPVRRLFFLVNKPNIPTCSLLVR